MRDEAATSSRCEPLRRGGVRNCGEHGTRHDWSAHAVNGNALLPCAARCRDEDRDEPRTAYPRGEDRPMPETTSWIVRRNDELVSGVRTFNRNAIGAFNRG